MKNFPAPVSPRETTLKRPIFAALWVGALACSVSLACGSDPPADSGNDAGTDSGTGGAGNGTDSGTGGAGSGTDSGTGGGSSSSGGSGSSSGGSGSSSDDPDDACGSSQDVGSGNLGGSGSGTLPGFDDCTGSSFESEASEADIFFLVDRSVSMGDHNVVENDPNSPTRWEALTTALKEFINDPSSETLRVGLGFFPKFGDETCDVDAYATPDVAIDFLTDNAGPLTDAIDENTSETNDGALFPTYGGLTPSIPAFTGALTYAKQWAEDHPERPVVVVFATDGYPTDPTDAADDCDDTSISSLEALAEEYLNGDPRISTFVVGIGEVSNLKRVADAGGTNDAFFVNDCPTAIEDLTESLKRVANSPALCSFDIPEPPVGQTIDPDEVNMVFTPKSGAPEIIYKVPASGNCGSSGGWYFDNSNEPERIYVCPETCSMFGGGTIEIVVGCESQVLG